MFFLIDMVINPCFPRPGQASKIHGINNTWFYTISAAKAQPPKKNRQTKTFFKNGRDPSKKIRLVARIRKLVG